nr:hypothetical protein [Tanacetum cinerariifolium]
MTSFDYRLNPLYPIKECSSCGALYTTDYCFSDGSLRDKIICDLNKTPDLSQRPLQNCANCGNPVDGQYCQGCALLRKELKEVWFTYCIENGIFQGLLDTFESSNENTNIVNAPQEPFVVKQDPSKNSSQSSPHINHHCCYGCGDSLEYIFCHQCSCESCGKGGHYGYNCPPKVPVVSNPKPCHNQNVDELPQTLPSFHPTCYSGDEDSFVLDSTPNFVNDSPNETILEIEHALEDKHCQSEDILELFRRLHNDVQNIHEELAVYINTSSGDRPTIFYNDDDDEDYTIAITPILSIEEPGNSLSMGDEYIDTIPATESDESIKSSVENLVPMPSESEGIPDNMCDVPFHENFPPLDISKDQFEDFFDSNDYSTSIDNDSFSIDDIEYVEASPPDYELISSEVMEIVISEEGRIDVDILLTIKDNILREKSLNINLLIANIEALKDNPTPYSDFMTKSSSTSLNFLLEETNTFDNSLPESEIFCFDLEEISSGSTTTRDDISLPDYEAFYDDHVKEINSDSTTTHSDFSLYDSFIFDLSINPFPPADRSDFYHEEFADEHAHIISPPNESLFAYVVWIFLPFLSYSVSPQYLLSFGNEDTIFDPGISSYHISSFMPDVSHQSGTFIKFNVYPKHLNGSPIEILWTNEFGVESGSRLG